MANVSLRDVMKVYDKKVVAVQKFNLEIADKEFIVLVGPSGCGKSTTLRMVAGLEDISSGEVYIGDRLVNKIAPKDRDVAMVFQNYALYPHMTVYENMAFALRLRKMNKQEIDTRVRNAAELLGITDLLDRRPKALSGGQRQRVAIGRAIVREPHVFLMDEPLSNLDAKLRNQMRAEIIKLRQRVNTTFIYVTHDQTEAMTLGDRIVIMKAGYVMQIGTPHQVFNQPENLFVAGFIGSPMMNFFNAELENNNGKYVVNYGGVAFDVAPHMQEILKKSKTESQVITLGVRPEHISIAEPGSANTISAVLDVCEMMGSEYYLHINLDGNDYVIRVQVVDLPEIYKNGFKMGEKISFTFKPELMHMFNPETEINLVYPGVSSAGLKNQ
ncbi:MAG: sn-glycerol-3-phosphate ABC transporter ATP-binding protein UgpC [Clostridia bacterium]|nr:sn-glycerol-3-phosphate ABC transporter ATP-binding protein UgpC [Clostridia bacterium]